jgi:hypothetical protein
MIAFLIIGVFALLLWETGWELGLIQKKNLRIAAKVSL